MPTNIKTVSGNLLDADVEALVNTVNTVGVMGKGIALQFKQAFPENYAAYVTACKHGELQPGKMFVTQTGALAGPRYIINFPTKLDWRSRAKMEDIEAGLSALVAAIREQGIRSIAIPPLGCGNGGLKWSEVRPRIEIALAALPDVRVLLYEPDGAPKADAMRIATTRPNMTPARAAIVGLLDQYAIPGYRVTMLEIQKLAYFLQSAGEPLQITFNAKQFGPYAETLHHVLQRVEGHFLRGYGDRTRGAEMQILPDAVDEAQVFLDEHPETRTRMKRVFDLIDGFETPYGLELLATVHWLAHHSADPPFTLEAAIEGVHNWSERKKGTFSANHIETAWQRLRDQAWI